MASNSTVRNSTAREVLEILENGSYRLPSGAFIDIRDAQKRAEALTQSYSPEDLDTILDSLRKSKGSRSDIQPRYSVVQGTTQEAAHELVQEENCTDLVLLNFASAKNPGGGFINGAKAQEEDLCRCSGLYPCLLTQPRYYQTNRFERSLLYTDFMIYSPQVPWFRADENEFLETPFNASVITAPAPNAGEVIKHHSKDRQNIEKVLRLRAGKILALAWHHGHRTLLLGAWGCGVFRNDPSLVADAFGRWLESDDFSGVFDHVVFSILDNSKDQRNIEPFRKRFA